MHQVLIVLDGWDEFPPGLDGNSIIKRLICGPSHLNMQFSALIITSRPIHACDLVSFDAHLQQRCVMIARSFFGAANSVYLPHFLNVTLTIHER